MTSKQPLVSVVTPVYNGEAYLRECIETVLAQTYHNWEYIVLNNCSTDRTQQIIQEYADNDKRIKIYKNDEVLPIMDNWNTAMQKISPKSKYCKVVHADDMLFPECLDSMIEIGEQNPTTGVIGSYTLKGQRVACDGLPLYKKVFSGHEICRQSLLKQIYPFLSPSALMIRSDLIHKRNPFYPGPNLEADVDVMYELLKDCDFGFVHQVLTFVRRHEASATSTLAKPLNTLLPQNFRLLIKHGQTYLTKNEYDREVKARLRTYYQFLSNSTGTQNNKEFWLYHKDIMEELGYPLSSIQLRIFWLLQFLTKLKNKIELALITWLTRLANFRKK